MVRERLLPRFAPVSILALLATLVFIFAFQADNITGRYIHVFLIAVPILMQVYLNSSLAYGLMRLLKFLGSVAAPGALIGASNFFELAVATAIALFGAGSGAALATVVGVLMEVPVMLSVCTVCNRTRHWFPVTEALGRRSELGRWRILCTAMNAYRWVKPEMQSGFAIIVLLRCAGNTSVRSTTRSLLSIPWYER